jgi:hypothetical protein
VHSQSTEQCVPLLNCVKSLHGSPSVEMVKYLSDMWEIPGSLVDDTRAFRVVDGSFGISLHMKAPSLGSSEATID